MNGNRLLRFVSIFDLCLISVWALFFYWSTNLTLVLILVLGLRFAASFTLAHRQKHAVWPIAAFTALFLLLSGVDSMTLNEYVLMPLAKMYDCVVFLFQGHSTIQEGAYHYIGHNGIAFPHPGQGWMVWTALWLAWIVLEPVVAYVVLLVKRCLVADKWPWKKVVYLCVFFVVFGMLMLAFDQLNYAIRPHRHDVIWLLLLLAPLVLRVRKEHVPTDVCRYGIMAGIFAVTLMVGFDMARELGLVAVLFSTCAFAYFVGVKWEGASCDGSSCHIRFYPIVAGGFLFWLAQYGAGVIRIVLLVASAACMAYSAWVYYRQTHRPVKSVLMFLTCAFVLPSLSVGYNQYSNINAKRWYNFGYYDYSSQGLLCVLKDGQVGIRDRYGMVVPCDYDKVEPFGNPAKPFVWVQKNEKWGLYDLECQELTVPAEYETVFEDADDAWTLVQEGEGVRYRYSWSPYRYNREKSNGGVELVDSIVVAPADTTAL